MTQKQVIVSRGKWEITNRNLRAIKKEVAILKKRIKKLENKK